MTDPTENRRLDFLDGLRAFAIALVMLLHYWEITWFDFSYKSLDLNFLATTGSMGVTLFFFISGFCLYLSYNRHQSLRYYANRRIFKIVPSYFLSILLIYIFFDFPYPTVYEFLKHTVAHLLFIHNLFPDTYSSINGVYWSLAVEVQFYLLFPFVFDWIKKYPVRSFLVSFVFAQGFRTFVAIWNPERFDPWINQLPAYLDVFTAGIASGALYSHWKVDPPKILRSKLSASLVTLLGFLVFFGCLYWYHLNRFEPGIPRTQPWGRGVLTLSFIMISLGSAFTYPIWNRLIANPVASVLSLVSYNLYLWHQYIAHQLLMAKIPNYSGDPHYDFDWQKKFLLLAVSASVLIAWLLTRFFEEPILKKTKPK